MRELDVCSADHLDGFHDVVRVFLKTLLGIFGNCKHWRRAIGVAGVNTHRVDVFDEADRDHVVFCITDNFKLQFFPADDGFLNQDLTDEARGYAAVGDQPQFFEVIHNSSAGAAHRIGRSDHHRVTHLGGDFFRFFNRGCGLASGHLNSQLVHGFFKCDPVLAPFNGVYLYPDDLYIVFLQNAEFVQF